MKTTRSLALLLLLLLFFFLLATQLERYELLLGLESAFESLRTFIARQQWARRRNGAVARAFGLWLRGARGPPSSFAKPRLAKQQLQIT